MLYSYILQESFDSYWVDKLETNERKFIEELLKVYRKKNTHLKYRVVRLIR